MINNYNKIKLILGKIKIAQCNYKKVLELKILYTDLSLLNILWKQGFIYGYTKINNFYFLFLKYNLQGLGLLRSIVFVKVSISKKQLNNFRLIDPHYNYLIITTKGLLFHSGPFIRFGGTLIAKF